MQYVFKFIKFIFDTTAKGFYSLCTVLSKGFFFYFYFPFYLLSKMFNNKIIIKIRDFFKRLQNNPTVLLVIIIIVCCGMIFEIYYHKTDDLVVYVPDTNEVDDKTDNQKNEDNPKSNGEQLNLYKKFSSYKIEDIDFKELKKLNTNVVGWVIVDSTNVNYPVLKTDNNDYYLNHSFYNNYTSSGWIFMDYRNNVSSDDYNTIIYGHNLTNKTAFGSLSNLFTEKWFRNSSHRIILLTESGKYTYEIFSVYYSDAEVYYLKTNFGSLDEYNEFLVSLKNRSKFDFGINLDENERILTLSTCTDDNLGRKVIHARLVGY